MPFAPRSYSRCVASLIVTEFLISLLSISQGVLNESDPPAETSTGSELTGDDQLRTREFCSFQIEFECACVRACVCVF